MRLMPIAQLELLIRLQSSEINAGSGQPPAVFIPLPEDQRHGRRPCRRTRIQPDEWEQYAVLLVHTVKESTDVTRVTELGSGTGNGAAAG
jgi:hypothetical protein